MQVAGVAYFGKGMLTYESAALRAFAKVSAPIHACTAAIYGANADIFGCSAATYGGSAAIYGGSADTWGGVKGRTETIRSASEKMVCSATFYHTSYPTSYPSSYHYLLPLCAMLPQPLSPVQAAIAM
eukprot:1106722-Rhodomonas_salina.1